MTRPIPPCPGMGAARARLAEMLRVDHAGELAAGAIYRGQRAVLRASPGAGRSLATIADMEAQEDEHLARFDAILLERRVRPSLLAPLWRAAGFGLGAATALIGERAAHACTEAVETVIEGHYAGQIAELGAAEPALAAELSRFRDDEIAHRDIAVAEGAHEAPAYPLLSAVVRAGCRAAIRIAEKVWPMDIDAMRREAEAPVQAGPGDLLEVVQTLTDAFAVDPHLDWFMRDDAARDHARLGFFHLLVSEIGLTQGRIDRPVGGGAAAVWMPFEALGPIPILTELRILPTLLRATGLARFGRLMAIRADMDRHHPMDRAHAYLQFLGVSPAAQGRGVGSALLRAANARLDAANMPAYLETGTTRNVALYERHGFKVLSTHTARADAPPMWSMWREPRRGG